MKRGILILFMFVFPTISTALPRQRQDSVKGDRPLQADSAAPISGPFNLKSSIPVSNVGSVLFPLAPSPFVAVTPPQVRDKSELRVYDLRTMKPVGRPLRGQFKSLIPNQRALSPDGAYLAVVDPSAKRSVPVVQVWSVPTGQIIHNLAIDDNPQIKVGLVEFAGKDRLLVMKHKGQFVRPDTRSIYEIWDLKAGSRTGQFAQNFAHHRKWGGFSPGGKYMVLEGSGTYRFYFFDLVAGRPLCDFPFQNRQDPWGQAAGMVFSPDGKELAMIWRLGQKPNLWGRLFVYDLEKQEKILDHPISYDPPGIDSLWSEGGPRCLQWWPPRKGWILFGHLLVDRDSGAVVYKLPPAPRFSGEIVPRRFLDADHITTIEGTTSKQLRVIRLPRADIQSAVQRAHQKGSKQ